MKGVKLLLLILFLVISFFCIYFSFASPNQPNNNLGYEYLDNVIHIWNENDDYYFNSTSAIQLTNHYNQYWTRNILCIAYKTDEWNYFCTDNLPITLQATSDNQTYVNLTGYRDVTIANKSVRLELTYSLNSNDNDLTITPKITNLGSNITNELGFAWKVTDIQISMTEENDYARVDNEEFILHNSSLDQTYSNLNNPNFTLFDSITEQYLYLKWNNNLNYLLKVKSNNNYNADVILLIRFNGLNANETKSTDFYWYDSNPCSSHWYSETNASYTNFSDGANMRVKGNIQGYCYKPICQSGEPESYYKCSSWYRLENNSWAYINDSITNVGENCYYMCDEEDTCDLVDTWFNLPHNNKVDVAICYCGTNDQGCGECSINDFSDWTCFSNNTQLKLDEWDDKHTPTAENVSLPSYVTDNESLTCNYTFVDFDNDSENVTKRNVQWYINNVYNSSFDDQITINAEDTSYGQSWQCRVKVFDNVFTTGKENFSSLSNSAMIITKVKSLTTEYVTANGKLIAKQRNDTNTISYYHDDLVGSTSLITNENGEVESKQEYYPFGSSLSSSGIYDKFKFTGKEYDNDLDQYYFLARNYLSDAGRFTSIDPMLNPSVSPYSYANNNPFKFVDPSGEKPIEFLAPGKTRGYSEYSLFITAPSINEFRDEKLFGNGNIISRLEEQYGTKIDERFFQTMISATLDKLRQDEDTRDTIQRIEENPDITVVFVISPQGKPLDYFHFGQVIDGYVTHEVGRGIDPNLIVFYERDLVEKLTRVSEDNLKSTKSPPLFLVYLNIYAFDKELNPVEPGNIYEKDIVELKDELGHYTLEDTTYHELLHIDMCDFSQHPFDDKEEEAKEKVNKDLGKYR